MEQKVYDAYVLCDVRAGACCTCKMINTVSKYTFAGGLKCTQKLGNNLAGAVIFLLLVNLHRAYPTHETDQTDLRTGHLSHLNAMIERVVLAGEPSSTQAPCFMTQG